MVNSIPTDDSMKALIFADPHITKDAAFSRPTQDGLTTYLWQVRRSFEWIFNRISCEHPDIVICLGDLTDTTGFVDTASLNVVHDLSAELVRATKRSNQYAEVYYLVGNHDFYSLDHNLHNLKFLNDLGISVIDKPRVTQSFADQIPFFCIPWVENLDNVQIPSGIRFIISHLDIKGSLITGGGTLPVGADPHSFDLPVFNGHLHMPSEVGKVVNVGALLSRDFRDANSPPRGIVWLDVYESSLKFLRESNPHEIPFQDIKIFSEDDATKFSGDKQSNLQNSYARITYDEKYAPIVKSLSSVPLKCRTSAVIPVKTSSEITIGSCGDLTSIEDYFNNYINEAIPSVDRKSVRDLGLKYIATVGSLYSLSPPPPLFLERIKATNFQLFADLDYDLSQPGLYCVEGRNEEDDSDSNEAGKSTVHECIYWALTGKSLRKGYTATDVVKWGEKSCRVELYLRVNNVRYKIVRARNDQKYGTASKLFIWEDGDFQNLSPRRNQDASKEIDALLRRSPLVFKHSVFLTAGFTDRFTTLSYPARVKLIEEVAGLEQLAFVETEINKDLNDLSGEVLSASTTVRNLESIRTVTESRIENLQKMIIEEEERILDSTQSTEIIQDVSVHEQRITELRNQNDLLETKRKNVLKKFEDIECRLSVTINAHRQVSNSLAEASSTLSHLKKSASNLQKLIDQKRCGTCGQEVNEASVTFKQLLETQNTISKTGAQVDTLSSKTQRLQEKIDKQSEEKQVSYQRNLKLLALKQDNEKEICNLNDLIKKITEHNSKVNSNLESLKARKLEAEENLFKISEDIMLAEDSLFDLEKSEKLLSLLSGVFSVKGIRSHILFSTILPYMNQQLAGYSEIMGKPCRLSYKRNKSGALEDKIDVTQSGKYKEQVPYNSNSSGGARKIDLAIQCAFRDLALKVGGAGVNLLVCDEIDYPLDSLGLTRFLEILKKQSVNLTVLMTAHRPFFSSLFDKKFTVVRSEGTSRIVGFCSDSE